MNQKTRQKVLERDDHECHFCESEENLHVHHIIPRKADGSDKPYNLKTVCGSCHKKIEKMQSEGLKRIKEERNDEKIEELENKVQRLEDKLADRYTFDEFLAAAKKVPTSSTLYIVRTPLICSDKKKIEYTSSSRENALEKLEELRNAQLDKWYIDVNIEEALKTKESKMAYYIDNDRIELEEADNSE